MVARRFAVRRLASISLVAHLALVAPARSDTPIFAADFEAGSLCPWSSFLGSEEECAVCGDGQINGVEACDDGDTDDGNGCSSTCTVENGWECAGSPSVCLTTCGDGIIVGAEQCDDTGIANGDGCSEFCEIEHAWICTGQPSVCTATCGDGAIAAGVEECDDMGMANGDGCSSACQVEPGYQCNGEPSVCSPI